jgi:hypothetical protein
MDWVRLALDWDQWRAVVNTVMNLTISKSVGKFLSGRAVIGFSRRTRLHGMSNLVS